MFKSNYEIVKDLRDPYWQCLPPAKRIVISSAADVIEDLMAAIDGLVEELEDADTTP